MYIVLDQEPDDGLVMVTLPMPADYRTSFSGSGLPFPREDMAFGERSRAISFNLAPGSSILQLNANRPAPNWYYRNGVYGPPHAKVAYRVDDNLVKRMLPILDVPKITGRSLTAVSKSYAAELRRSRDKVVETQYAALCRRGMPGKLC